MLAKTQGDRSYDGSAAWHPFTQMQEFLSVPPVVVQKGSGCWLEDEGGHRYLDATASIWTNTLGHAHPEIDKALTGQLGKVAHSTYLGLSHRPGNDLEQALARIAPQPLTRVFYSDNGSTAVEVALKLSFQFWQLTGQPRKTRVLAMQDAYHGDTFGTMSVGGSDLFHQRFGHWCFATDRFTRPARDGSDLQAVLEGIGETLASQAHETAALILEPWIQGAAGMQLQPEAFVKEIETLCREHGVHLILDEVFTGFGRAGPMLVCRETGVSPDFLCLAKGLTAGYIPLAATMAKENIYGAFLGEYAEYRHFFHGHTFTANPLGAAVALRNIELLEELLPSSEHRNRLDTFAIEVQATFSGHPKIREIRQRGFACALDLATDAPRAGHRIAMRAREFGLLLRPIANTLLLVPPLVINPDEIQFLCLNTEKAISNVLK
jgi:adenosylmethionine-8-amino-7-oxononanoate aminotransferase